MKLLLNLLLLCIRGLVLMVEVVCWIGHACRQAVTIGRDIRAARGRVVDGMLTCPAGHPIPLEGGVYECSACGYTYEGSMLQCANAECGAITVYINCPTCGLSVRNPYRWGRP